MRKALVIGVNEYRNVELFRSLSSAKDDARKVKRRLSSNADGSENFDVRSVDGQVSRARLRREIQEFFAHAEGHELAFYFSGHGVSGPAGGFLVASDAEQDDAGVPMQEVADLGAGSGAAKIVLLLDCCSAGSITTPSWAPMLSVLRKNMTVVTASLNEQAALESANSGLFTAALLDALDGAAADLLGNVSVSGVYAHIERRFGPWRQRPVMKSYMTESTILRKVESKLSERDLGELTVLFASDDTRYPLDPRYDPWSDPEGKILQEDDPAKRKIGKLFKRLRDAGLVRATNGDDFWWVAQRRGTLELTPVGKEYWKLIKRKQP